MSWNFLPIQLYLKTQERKNTQYLRTKWSIKMSHRRNKDLFYSSLLRFIWVWKTMDRPCKSNIRKALLECKRPNLNSEIMHFPLLRWEPTVNCRQNLKPWIISNKLRFATTIPDKNAKLTLSQTWMSNNSLYKGPKTTDSRRKLHLKKMNK